MSFTLAGSAIPTPSKKTESSDAIVVNHKCIDGTNTRDFVGTEKRIFECEWANIEYSDFQTIKNAYEDQRDNGTAKNLTISETGLSFNANVLITIG